MGFGGNGSSRIFCSEGRPERVISAAPTPEPPSGCGISCLTSVLTFTKTTRPQGVFLGSLTIYEPAMPRLPRLKTKGHTLAY